MKTFLKGSFKKVLSIGLTVTLILTVFACAMVPVSAETTVDTSKFSAYYSANISENDTLSSVSVESQWENKETNLYRSLTINGNQDSNDWGSGVVKYMSVLYWNVKEYRAFDMTVNYHTHEDAGNHIAFVGFGAEKGKSWLANEGDHPFVLRADGCVYDAKTNTALSSTSAKSQTETAGSTWGYTTHKLRMKVAAGSYNIWIDDYLVVTGTLDSKYTGGYIYFAANAGSVYFEMPTVTEIVDTSLFDAYYTESLSANEDLTKATLSDIWEVNSDGTRVKRKFGPYNNEGNNDWGGLNSYASVLYYNAKQYDNFIMTVDYKVAADNCTYALVGFGGELGKSWKHSDKDVTLAISPDGSILNVANDDWLASGSSTASGQTTSAGKTWNATGVHTLKIKMVYGKYTIWIDDYKIGERTATLNKGYIYFAATAGGAEFSVPKVTEILDTSSYASYFCSDLSDNNTMQIADISTNWTVSDDGKRLQRRIDPYNNEGNNDWGGLSGKSSLLYINKSYTDFCVSLDYKLGTPDTFKMVYFGFGGELGKSFKTTTSDTTFVISADGSLMNAENESDWYATGTMTAATQTNAAGGTWNNSDVHNLKLKMASGKLTVWIDGYEIGQRTISNYTGGYIYFGANGGFNEFGAPTITVPFDTDAFSAYYTTDAKASDDLTSEAVTSHWTVGGSEVVRKFDDSNWDSATKNISYLVYNKKKYKSFELEFDYKVIHGHEVYANHGCYFGFGLTEMGKSPYSDDNANTYGIIQYGTVLNEDYTSWITNRRINTGKNELKSHLLEIVEDYDMWDTHTLKAVVKNNLLDVYIDDIWVYGVSLPQDREAGYIYFGSNEGSTTFGVPKIKELTDDKVSDEVKTSVLYGKNALFIGDSISFGALDSYDRYAWGGRIGNKYGMNWVNNSVSGASIGKNTIYPYIGDQLANGSMDYVVIEGGINDAMNRPNEIGTVSTSFDPKDFDENTFAGALEHLFATVIEKYPQAAVGYIVTFKAWTPTDDNADQWYAVARTICDKWGISYLDLYNDSDCDSWFVESTGYMPDALHPNAKGYDLVTPKIETWMQTLKSRVAGDANVSGAVDTADVEVIRKALLGTGSLTKPCDANDDYLINLADLLHVKNILAK